MYVAACISGIYGYRMTFSNQADIMFNMTLLHQDYHSGTFENSNCKPFVANKPCLRKFLPLYCNYEKIC